MKFGVTYPSFSSEPDARAGKAVRCGMGRTSSLERAKRSHAGLFRCTQPVSSVAGSSVVQSAAPSSATAVSFDTQVRAQLIAVLYSRARASIFSNVATAFLTTAFFFFQKAPLGLLAVWFGLFVVLAVGRLILVRRYDLAKPSVELAPRWGHYYAMTIGAAGALWSIGAFGVFVLLPPTPEASMFFGTALAGVGMASVLAFAPYLSALYSIVIPTQFSLIAGFLYRGDELHLIFAALITVALLLNLMLARSSHRTLADSIRFRFELEEKKAEAEAANIAKSKFLAAASHDLRQPLHALKIFGDLMHSGSGRDTRHDIVVDGIRNSTQALERLLNALLDLSQLDTGVLKPTIAHISLQSMFDRLRAEFGVQARAKGLGLRIVPCQYVARTDAAMLERILRNLLSNALRYTAAGGIVVGVRRYRGRLRIDVCDTGCGISADQVHRIFDEFYQVGNPQRDHEKGLGLGLTIVKRLAGMLDHPVKVESVVGRGSRFTVLVPRGDAAYIVTERAITISGFDLSDTCVLVIDDERSIRCAMSELLARWGCSAIVVDTVDEALAQFRRRGVVPDVILTDSRLREHWTGTQAVRRLCRAYNKSIPAIIMTGDTAAERLREAAASGYALLHKPVAPVKLRALMASLLDGARR
jgi:two-component system, sensor histidine kinase